MRIRFLICFISLFALPNTHAQTQSGVAVYKVKMNREAVQELVESDTIDGNLSNFLKMQFEKRRKEVPFLNYKLYFNREESLFENINAMKNDNGMDLQRASREVGSFGDFYINLKNNEVVNYLHYLDRHWLINRNLDQMQWEITNETKTIQGYLCQKATIDYHPNFGKGGPITAWFTTAIPFQFGPLGYAGLPGLIIQLEKDFYTIYIDEINLQKKNRKIAKPEKGEHYNFEEFIKEKKKREFEMKMQHVQQRE